MCDFSLLTLGSPTGRIRTPSPPSSGCTLVRIPPWSRGGRGRGRGRRRRTGSSSSPRPGWPQPGQRPSQRGSPGCCTRSWGFPQKNGEKYFPTFFLMTNRHEKKNSLSFCITYKRKTIASTFFSLKNCNFPDPLLLPNMLLRFYPASISIGSLSRSGVSFGEWTEMSLEESLGTSSSISREKRGPLDLGCKTGLFPSSPTTSE